MKNRNRFFTLIFIFSFLTNLFLYAEKQNSSKDLIGSTWSQIDGFQYKFPRDGHTSVLFDNKIWIIGGYGNNGYKNDI